MRVCHCALPAMTGSSDCCRGCPNNQETFDESYFRIVPYEPYKPMTKKEIIEKFDKDGNLIERITRG